MGIITLLTDFGTEDPYVAIMKGVILRIHPEACIVDISHSISPQDLLQAALTLEFAWPYFPEGSVHSVVVDPGVGSRRSVVALQVGGSKFLAPDNGVLTPVLGAGVDSVHRLENADLFLQPTSRTFHGRDIFAPVAARIAAGLPLAELGPAMPPASLQRIEMPRMSFDSEGNPTGQVIAVDHFGNLVTNLQWSQIRNQIPELSEKTLKFSIASHTICNLVNTYADVEPGELLVLVGSRGFLEISVCRGNASQALGVGVGAPVRMIKPPN